MNLVKINYRIYNVDKLRYISPIIRTVSPEKREEYNKLLEKLKETCINKNINTNDVFKNAMCPEEYIHYEFSVNFEKDCREDFRDDLQGIIKQYVDVMQSLGIYSYDRESVVKEMKTFGSYPTIYWDDYVKIILEERNGKLEKSCADKSIAEI